MQKRALELLKMAVASNAEFRSGQWEAIEAVLAGKKTLVVQRTGWGKSIVYFIATKLLRERGKGMCILISPLLSLIRNQISAAEKIGLIALTINSDNAGDWKNVEEKIAQDKCDILLISPERLGNESFRKKVINVIAMQKGIGMLVVDEAHCISDWGHDFRPDYRRIVRISNNLPQNVPVLATTATANDRVIADIKEQMGNDLLIIRGRLMRESLKLQVVKLNDQAERLAWLYENINKMPGSGIIYCLTKNDCNKVASYLRYKGINALEYHTMLSADSGENSKLANEREQLLMNNQVKALVATVKLGMGYDKPDLGFVIHFQRPGSIISYYQQIGRAGRKLDEAYVVLLNGKEDDNIQEFFINSTFPSIEEVQKVLKVIEEAPQGVTKGYLLTKLNMRQGRIDDSLKMLDLAMAIRHDNRKYVRTPNPWTPEADRISRVTKLRYHELQAMKDFVDYQDCYMEKISNELDDPYKAKCGKCSNCQQTLFFPDTVRHEHVIEAKEFFKRSHLQFEPRRQIPGGLINEKQISITAEMINETGHVLCNYGDVGWGHLVKEDKYEHGHFRDELVNALADMIRESECMREKNVWVTAVPSLRRPELVKSLAKRVAERLGFPFFEIITKIHDTEEQKHKENSFQQAQNAFQSFGVRESIPKSPVILIDDMVDSKWTLTVCGYRLKGQGVAKVFPFVLASTAEGGLE